jgi:hypothetical protein
MCIKINKVIYVSPSNNMWRPIDLSSFFSLYPGGGGRYTDLPYEACDEISDFCHQYLLRKM